jgi:TrmH family RNA methyltransferase
LITSNHNPKIKWVRDLQKDPDARRQAGAFVVEGVRLAEEALQAGWKAQLLLVSLDINPRAQAVVEGLAAQGTPVEQVTESVMRSASDTQTPQGVLAVVEMSSLPLPNSPAFVFIPDGIRDPGNLGSMLRTAAAAGAEAVLVPSGGVDVYAPKVVRSAMGAHFRLPITSLEWPEIEAIVHKASLFVYLAEANTGRAYTQCDLRSPLALIVGGEAQGAGENARRLAQSYLHIPMRSGVESLNAAAAAAILLFEASRQRANENS